MCKWAIPSGFRRKEFGRMEINEIHGKKTVVSYISICCNYLTIRKANGKDLLQAEMTNCLRINVVRICEILGLPTWPVFSADIACAWLVTTIAIAQRKLLSKELQALHGDGILKIAWPTAFLTSAINNARNWRSRTTTGHPRERFDIWQTITRIRLLQDLLGYCEFWWAQWNLTLTHITFLTYSSC